MQRCDAKSNERGSNLLSTRSVFTHLVHDGIIGPIPDKSPQQAGGKSKKDVAIGHQHRDDL